VPDLNKIPLNFVPTDVTFSIDAFFTWANCNWKCLECLEGEKKRISLGKELSKNLFFSFQSFNVIFILNGINRTLLKREYDIFWRETLLFFLADEKDLGDIDYIGEGMNHEKKLIETINELKNIYTTEEKQYKSDTKYLENPQTQEYGEENNSNKSLNKMYRSKVDTREWEENIQDICTCFYILKNQRADDTFTFGDIRDCTSKAIFIIKPILLEFEKMHYLKIERMQSGGFGERLSINRSKFRKPLKTVIAEVFCKLKKVIYIANDIESVDTIK